MGVNFIFRLHKNLTCYLLIFLLKVSRFFIDKNNSVLYGKFLHFLSDQRRETKNRTFVSLFLAISNFF